MNAGIGYLSEDRKRFGLLVDKSVEENTTLSSLEKFTKGLFIDGGKEKTVSEKYVQELKTKTPNVKQIIKKLSGGNQQKVVIAKWLVKDSEILIFDEPTRGIDVGAKEEIYLLINELAASGLAVVVISSELPEVIGICDRIITICEGRLTGEISKKEATQEILLAAATKRKDVGA